MNASANTDEKNYPLQFKVNNEKLRAHTRERNTTTRNVVIITSIIINGKH